MAPDCVGPAVEKLAQALQPGGILLLENLRFHPEEEANDPAFAKQLASLAMFLCRMLLAQVHRAHASTAGVAALLPSAPPGFLLAKEIYFLSKALENPERPFIAILGGAKVSDKIAVIDSLLEKVNGLVIGGAMAYTFMKAQGVGSATPEWSRTKLTWPKVRSRRPKKTHPAFLPLDHVVVERVTRRRRLRSHRTGPSRMGRSASISARTRSNRLLRS